MKNFKELFTQLQEAWITVANIEQEGALGSTNLYLKSSPCGTTAAFCLGADGQDISSIGPIGTYNLELSMFKNLILIFIFWFLILQNIALASSDVFISLRYV